MNAITLDPKAMDEAVGAALSTLNGMCPGWLQNAMEAGVRAYLSHAPTAATTKPRWERWRLFQDPEQCSWLLIAGKHPEGEPLVDCDSVVVIASLEWRGLIDSAPWSLKLGMYQSPRGFDTAEAAAAWTSEMLGDDLPLPVTKS